MMSAPARAWFKRLGDKHGDGRVVDDLLAVENPVMAVARIRIERDIGDDADLRYGAFDGACRATDEVGFVQSLARFRIAQRWVGMGKQRQRGNSELGGHVSGAHGFVD